MLTTPVISIVVPLYYCHPKLYQIIDKFFISLKKHYPDVPLVVVDDASSLPLPPHWPVMVKNQKNKGYTHSVNRGLSLAFINSEVAIVANDDLEIRGGDLEKFFTIKKDGIYFPSDSASGNLDIFGSIWGLTYNVWHKLGKLDEKYKHFYSDRDYYNRAVKAKIPIIHWKDVCILHHESATYNLTDKQKLLARDKKKFVA